MTPPLRVGCTYDVQVRGRAVRIKLLRYDPIDRIHIVTAPHGREMRFPLNSTVRTRVASKKTDTRCVFLYLCDIGNCCFKLGATSDPDRRCKQIRTYAPKAAMRARFKVATGTAFRKYEKAVLSRFAHAVQGKSGGREVLHLSRHDVGACIEHMRRVAQTQK